MSAITINEVSKRYRDGTLAVRDLSLEVADGEFMILVGPSGCGKTTLLRMLAGLEQVTGGTISIGDRVVNELEPRERDIAMVFQNYALYPHMTVARNMGFALKRAKVPGSRDPAQGPGGGRAARDHRSAGAQARQSVGRPAPAGGHGPRDRARSAGVSDGRAAVEPRRQAAPADALRDRPHPAAAEHDDGVRHPRPDRGDDARRPGRGDARRRAAAGGDPAGALRASAQPVRRRLHRRAADELHARTGDRRDAGLSAGGDPAGPARTRGRRRRRDAGRVVVGVRPEDFEDAAVAGERGRGVHVRATIDVLESTGSDIYAHLSIDGASGEDEVPQALLDGIAAAEGEDGPRPASADPRWWRASTLRATCARAPRASCGWTAPGCICSTLRRASAWPPEPAGAAQR